MKSGKLNNRLLFEMIEHEKFQRLLADIEIYVDNIAGMQIRNLNSLIDVARDEVIAKYNSSENDSHLRALEAARIDENEYFCHLVNEDTDEIIRDIRAAHKFDSMSVPEMSVAENIKEDIEEVVNFKGSKMEKAVVFYCKQLGIDYRKLTEEDSQWLVRILEKSKLYRGNGRSRIYNHLIYRNNVL